MVVELKSTNLTKGGCKVMTNTLKLRALLVENNLTNEEIAKKLGISKQSFSMKINNKREFRVSEINKLSALLNLSNPSDIMTIFFANRVELNSTCV